MKCLAYVAKNILLQRLQNSPYRNAVRHEITLVRGYDMTRHTHQYLLTKENARG